ERQLSRRRRRHRQVEHLRDSGAVAARRHSRRRRQAASRLRGADDGRHAGTARWEVIGHRLLAAGAVVAVCAVHAAPAAALPTMIRLGYTDCAACHLSPQGGGPLNAYGRGIDQAQSLRGGESKTSPEPWVEALSLGGRVTQDVRTVMQRQATWATDKAATMVFRPRFMYRNVTAISEAFRVAATVTAETQSAPRPALSYDPS